MKLGKGEGGVHYGHLWPYPAEFYSSRKEGSARKALGWTFVKMRFFFLRYN